MLSPTGEAIAARLRRLPDLERDAVPLRPRRRLDAHVIAVCNPKTGTARTTTAVFLAHALAQRGHRVLLIDADPDAATSQWSGLGRFPFPTLAAPVPYLDRLLPGWVGDVDQVVIDTPARRQHAAVTRSAMQVADQVLVPMAPSPIELHITVRVFPEIASVRRSRGGGGPATAVLLNRVHPQAASTDAFRVVLAEWGHRVLTTAVPARERYAQAFGGPVIDPGAYTPAAGELLSPPDRRRPRLACAMGQALSA